MLPIVSTLWYLENGIPDHGDFNFLEILFVNLFHISLFDIILSSQNWAETIVLIKSINVWVEKMPFHVISLRLSYLLLLLYHVCYYLNQVPPMDILFAYRLQCFLHLMGKSIFSGCTQTRSTYNGVYILYCIVILVHPSNMI